MKREQLEKIARAALQLRDALGLGTVSITRTEHGARVTVYPDCDEDVQALCGLYAQTPDTCRHACGWWLFSSFELSGLRINVIGPTHHDAELARDDARVDAAVAHAEAVVDDVAADGPSAFAGSVDDLEAHLATIARIGGAS